MLMGRWLSQAFLAYIWPQVIEWTNNMSQDMIRHDSYTNASGLDMADPAIARVPHAGSTIVLITCSLSQPSIWSTEGVESSRITPTSDRRDFNGSGT